MIILTESILKKLAPSAPSDVGKFALPLDLTFAKYEIDTLERMCMFLANVAHESGAFRYVRELGGPSYFKKYEGRKDLGNNTAGDGVKYFGRGLIQLTGRANYTEISKDLDHDFVNHPEHLEEPTWAAMSAGWFWHKRGLNALADQGKFVTVVRRINGGVNGLQERQLYYSKAKILLTPLYTAPTALTFPPGHGIGDNT